MGGYINGGNPIVGFIIENPIGMDDWGYPYLRKPSYGIYMPIYPPMSSNVAGTSSN